MLFTEVNLLAIWLTIKLASLVTLILLVLCVPLAWWLNRSNSWFNAPINAFLALPLVLPPTVLGFYLLLLLGPSGFVGQVLNFFGVETLTFSFSGLVIASVIYSFPFVFQPIQSAMGSINVRSIEVAATLGANSWDTFFSVVIPSIKQGLITASVLGFAHTLGEFGIVLMVGGNIPGETQVVSVLMYEHVEALEYGQAHWLAGVMVFLSFMMLLGLYAFSSRSFQRFGF